MNNTTHLRMPTAASRQSRHQNANVGPKLRDVLVQDFLEQHPELSRSQIVTRTVNGKAVCDSVESVAQEIVRKRRFTDSTEDREFILRQCQLSAEERHQACQSSIASSKKMIDFLFSTKLTPFGAKDKSANLNFLTRCERISLDRTQAVIQINKDLVEQLQGSGVSREASVRSHMVRYFHALIDQLRSQAAIYKREFRLGEQLRASVRDFIAGHRGEIRTRMAAPDLNVVMEVCQVSADENRGVSKLTSNDPKELEATLDDLGDRLQERRDQFEDIQRVIGYLENLAAELECTSRQELQSESKSRKDVVPPARRSRMYSVGAELLSRFERCIKGSPGMGRSLRVG